MEEKLTSPYDERQKQYQEEFENQMVNLITPSYWDKFKNWQKPYQVLFLSILTAIIIATIVGLCLHFLNFEDEKVQPQKGPPLIIRNLTLTTHSGIGCGGYKVWIEFNVGEITCNTSVIPEFDAGNNLLWLGEYLGSCRNLEFDVDLDEVNFKIKSTSKDKFCPKYFFAFMNHGVTFKSYKMFRNYDGDKDGRNTNEQNHVATKTQETIELPQARWIHG